MVEIEQLRRPAMALPEAVDESEVDRLAFSVGGKGFAWTYLVRTAPKTPRVPQVDVLAVRCPIPRKEMLIEAVADQAPKRLTAKFGRLSPWPGPLSDGSD